MKTVIRLGSLLFLAIFQLLGIIPTVHAQSPAGTPVAIVLTANGPLTPVMVEYIAHGLKTAADQQAGVVIIQLDTPGGGIDLMNEIIQDIRTSEVPVVVYVSPRNAMAGSAGTIITLSGHLSAMAPETTIGAASPVGSQGEDIGTTLESKVKEMLKAEARTLTKGRRPEAVALAENTIDNAKAVTAEEALNIGLVDLIAKDTRDLLDKIDGRSVDLNGKQVILQTRDAEIVPVEKSILEQVLELLVNPNLVFLLLSVGVQAILIELSSPGAWVPGFVGAVCLILAIYGLGIMPVNWFGLLFIALAFILFILEVKTQTFGALTLAGAGSFIAGALILFNSTRLPGFPTVSVPLVIGTGLALAASFFAIVTFAIRAQRTPVQTGVEAMPGQTGIVRSEINPRGTVQVGGEIWAAEADPQELAIEVGTRIKVVRVQGLKLIVRKINP